MLRGTDVYPQSRIPSVPSSSPRTGESVSANNPDNAAKGSGGSHITLLIIVGILVMIRVLAEKITK